MTWKFFWQILFLFSIFIFIIMFLKFTKSGFIDLKKYFKNDK